MKYLILKMDSFMLIKELDMNSHLGRNVNKMAKIFNLNTTQINNVLIEEKKKSFENISLQSSVITDKIDLNYDRTEEDDEVEDIFENEEKKIKSPKGKFGTHIFNIMKNKIRGIGKIISSDNSETKNQYLLLPKLDEDNNYSSQSLSQLWNIFKYIFQKSKIISKVIFKRIYICIKNSFCYLLTLIRRFNRILICFF